MAKNRMRISKKIVLSYGATLALTIAMGILASTGLARMSGQIRHLAENAIPTAQAVGDMNSGLDVMQRSANGLLIFRAKADRRGGIYDRFEKGLKQVEAARAAFQALPHDAASVKAFEATNAPWEEFVQGYRAVVEACRERDRIAAGKPDDAPEVRAAEARALAAWESARRAADPVQKAVAGLKEEMSGDAADARKTGEDIARFSIGLQLAAVAASILLVIGLAWQLVRSIGRDVRAVDQEARRLEQAVADGALKVRAEPANVGPDFEPVVHGMNATMEAFASRFQLVADYLDRISRGDLPPRIEAEARGDFGVARDAVNRSIEAIGSLVRDVERLARAGAEGRLDQRADAAAHQGEFRSAVRQVNALLDAVDRPLAVTSQALQQMARGEVPDRLGAGFAGRFGEMEQSLDACAGALREMVGAMRDMSKAQLAGELDAYVAEERFQGVYQEMMKGVNAGVRMHVDAVLEILGVLAAYAEGDFAPVLRRLPGKQAIANERLDLLRTNLTRFSAEVKALSAAAVEGKLSVRADAAAYRGDWKALVEGVNATLDAVVRPLHAAADYVERISRGDVPAPVAEPWPGEFETLKQSLNRCIAAVNALVADTRALADDAVAGKLEDRAEAARHQGDFRKVVEGVNATLDALGAPVAEARTVLERLARRDLTARMTGAYQGDHGRLRDALNESAAALDAALSQVSGAVSQVSSAATQIASSSQAVASGASEQAASLEETTSSLESVASMAKQSADNAQQANQLAEGASAAAGQGAAAVEQMTGAMQKIRAAAEGTAQIIRDINEIAFQTNLLALNAAVEAARAGEAGRGFAVVAEEVRSLALRSKEAAQKTEALIRDSVKQAGEGEATATRVAGTLSEIVGAVGKVSGIVAEITAAAREQAAGLEQVNRAIGEMDKVTQQNAASSEESSSAASELSGQSEELAGMVGAFRLSGTSSAPARLAAAPAARSLPAPAAAPRLPAPARAAPPRAPARALPPAPAPAPARNGHANGRSRNGIALRPEDLIPLDKDDLSEF